MVSCNATKCHLDVNFYISRKSISCMPDLVLFPVIIALCLCTYIIRLALFRQVVLCNHDLCNTSLCSLLTMLTFGLIQGKFYHLCILPNTWHCLCVQETWYESGSTSWKHIDVQKCASIKLITMFTRVKMHHTMTL